MEQGSRNERTAPTREGIVLCKSAIHAGRERVWGSCDERGQKFGSRWVNQPSQEVVPLLSIRIHSLFPPGTGGPVYGRDTGRKNGLQPLRPREERLTEPGDGPYPTGVYMC